MVRTIEVRTIDKESGLLAPGDADPQTVMEEYFLPGTAPTEYATREVLDFDAAALELLVPDEGTESGDATADAETSTPPVQRPAADLRGLSTPPSATERLPSVLD